MELFICALLFLSIFLCLKYFICLQNIDKEWYSSNALKLIFCWRKNMKMQVYWHVCLNQSSKEIGISVQTATFDFHAYMEWSMCLCLSTDPSAFCLTIWGTLLHFMSSSRNTSHSFSQRDMCVFVIRSWKSPRLFQGKY